MSCSRKKQPLIMLVTALLLSSQPPSFTQNMHEAVLIGLQNYHSILTAQGNESEAKTYFTSANGTHWLQVAWLRGRIKADVEQSSVRVDFELEQAREDAHAHEDAFKHTSIQAPTRSMVKNILVNTFGGVIEPNQNIMKIVPTDENTIVEAFIRPADVAFHKLGQPATVKLTAYHYSKYDGLASVLNYLRANTSRDETKARHPALASPSTSKSPTTRSKSASRIKT